MIQFIILQVILNSVQFFTAMHMISLVFTGKEPSFHCKGHPEVSDQDVCEMTPPCKEYEYGTEFTSIVSEVRQTRGQYLETGPDPIAMVIRVELFIHKPCRQKIVIHE